MAGIRITQRTLNSSVLGNLQNNLTRMQKLQEQLSSGKAIRRPSDSPNGTLQSMQLRGETRANSQYVRSAGDGLGWLSTLDGTLSSTSTILQKARSQRSKGAVRPIP